MKKQNYLKKICVAAVSITVIFSTLMPLTNANAFSFSWNRSLWPSLGNGFELLPSYSNVARVQKEINLISKDKETLAEDSLNAQPYLYSVYQQVKQRHMPAELALLPMVESNYYPYAVSYCGAEGLWQLMAPTAKDHNITMNWWYDGRRDFTDSTNAGLDQLQHLHNVFGDWLLAIAAYNTGEGNIHKAIAYNQKHHLPTDFWSLKLAKETEQYVPKLLALAAILKNPGKYGVNLPIIPNSSTLTSLTLNQPVNLAELAKITHMNSDELLRLNPAFLRWVTPIHGSYQLIVPNNKVRAVMAALPTFTSDNLWSQYTVTKNDTLKSIAQHHDVDVDTLNQINSLTNTSVHSGETLLIPINYSGQTGQSSTDTAAAPDKVKHTKSLSKPLTRLAADFSTHKITEAKIMMQLKNTPLINTAENSTAVIPQPSATPAAAQNANLGNSTTDSQTIAENTTNNTNTLNTNISTNNNLETQIPSNPTIKVNNLLNQFYLTASSTFKWIWCSVEAKGKLTA